MDQATNIETRLAESAPQKPALAQGGSNVLRRHIKENPKKASLARHRLWLDSIPHEYPMPYTPYKIGVYIRYFNQTRHENYLEKHIQQYMDDIALCPQWTLVDFYVDRPTHGVFQRVVPSAGGLPHRQGRPHRHAEGQQCVK